MSPELIADEYRSIYLVRHAEKQQDGTRDPSLTKQGHLRAEDISVQLKDKNISLIYSTDYKRTRETASPLVTSLKINLTLYDPRQLENFAKQLLADKGNVLVVGHSNTTPKLVELLGGDSHGPMDESQYSRLYHLLIDQADVKTVLLSSHANKANRNTSIRHK